MDIIENEYSIITENLNISRHILNILDNWDLIEIKNLKKGINTDLQNIINCKKTTKIWRIIQNHKNF